MATVIRLKRRVDEDPLNAFVLNCKRQRVDGSTAELESNANVQEGSSTILKFAGTFPKAEGIASHLQNIHKDQAKDAVSRVHRPSITPRNRLATKQNAQNNRFKIVNCTRSITNLGIEQTETAIPTTIVDVERDEVRLEEVCVTSGQHEPALMIPATHNGLLEGEVASQEQMHQPFEGQYLYENGVHYVYDLYVADTSTNVMHIPYFTGNLDELSVMVCDDPLYSSHRGLDSDDSSNADSEDSNAENNWRNDYPEEEDNRDDKSIGEEDILRAVEELDLSRLKRIDGDRELSSDDDYVRYDEGEEDGFAYTRDDGVLYTDEEDDSNSDLEGVDREDVRRFGTAYARYKARILREDACKGDESSSTSSEENFDLYD